MPNFGILNSLGSQQNQPAPLMGEAPALPTSSLPSEGSDPLTEIGGALGQLANNITPPTNPDGSKLFALAKQYVDNNEKDNAPVLMSVFGKMGKDGGINPQNTPWCAAFVNGVLEAGGVKGSGSLAARSLLNWGQETKQPSIGDVVVLSRGDDPSKGHTGFFAGFNDDGSVKVLGGNQGAMGEVSVANYPLDRVLGYRTIPTANQIKEQIAPPDANNRLPVIMAGIAHVESGGSKDPYTLISKASKNGDRAYGKYQIMGNNIPSWSKMATGKAMTPKEFMSSPAAQEKIAAYMMNQSLKQGYSPEDVASIWFSGRPQKKAGNAKDVYGTTVPAYVEKFKQGVNNYIKNYKQSLTLDDNRPVTGLYGPLGNIRHDRMQPNPFKV